MSEIHITEANQAGGAFNSEWTRSLLFGITRRQEVYHE